MRSPGSVALIAALMLAPLAAGKAEAGPFPGRERRP